MNLGESADGHLWHTLSDSREVQLRGGRYKISRICFPYQSVSELLEGESADGHLWHTIGDSREVQLRKGKYKISRTHFPSQSVSELQVKIILKNLNFLKIPIPFKDFISNKLGSFMVYFKLDPG